MTEKESMRFSKLHPKDIVERIKADGAAHNAFDEVYRISEDGLCNRDAFLCTALENLFSRTNNRDAYLFSLIEGSDCDIGEWSTSCWNSLKKAKGIYSLKEKKEHSPKILIGPILPETGYSILTNERNSVKAGLVKNSRHHIDWWIYDDQDVSVYFKELEVL